MHPLYAFLSGMYFYVFKKVYLAALNVYAPLKKMKLHKIAGLGGVWKKHIFAKVYMSNSFKKNSLYLFLKAFSDGDSIAFLRNVSEIHYFLIPVSSLQFIPIFISSATIMEKDFPSSLQECFTYQKACYLHVSRTFDHSCCIPLCEECSEFILLKLRTFDLSEVFEVAADVKHYLALSCLPVCIVSQNRDTSIWPGLLDTTIRP